MARNLKELPKNLAECLGMSLRYGMLAVNDLQHVVNDRGLALLALLDPIKYARSQ